LGRDRSRSDEGSDGATQRGAEQSAACLAANGSCGLCHEALPVSVQPPMVPGPGPRGPQAAAMASHP